MVPNVNSYLVELVKLTSEELQLSNNRNFTVIKNINHMRELYE